VAVLQLRGFRTHGRSRLFLGSQVQGAMSYGRLCNRVFAEDFLSAQTETVSLGARIRGQDTSTEESRSAYAEIAPYSRSFTMLYGKLEWEATVTPRVRISSVQRLTMTGMTRR
jgi:hypothetical protein